MDLSKIKNVFGKLQFLRNYSVYILPLILLGVAIGLLMVSLFMSGGLRSKIEKESIKTGKMVKTFSSQDISARQWQVEKQSQDALEADANGIFKLMRQTSERELLSYKLFPEPKDTSVLIFEEFGERYRRGIGELISSYGARECPTDVEIGKALEQMSSTGSQSTSVPEIGGMTFGGGDSSARMNKAEQMIVDELCLEAARKASFYAGPLDIAGYVYWGKEPPGDDFEMKSELYQYRSIQQSVEACWYWQIGYWIIEDMFKTIGAMNQQCNNVMDCPVKRLMRVSFISETAGSSGPSSNMSVPPGYVGTGMDDKSVATWHTGRVSNEQWDIVHFKASVLIDPRETMTFIDELCSVKEHIFRGWSGDQEPQKFKHNQITVLEVNINPVNLKAVSIVGKKGHERYRYGNDAVVEMELICEYIFERAGYDQIKPEFIKNIPEEEEEDY